MQTTSLGEGASKAIIARSSENRRQHQSRMSFIAHQLSEENRYRGTLLGLATGDALGTTVEFRAPGTFPPVVDIIGGGPFMLNPGEWTDDTSMSLCLAESLIERRGHDPGDQMKRYVLWFTEGHLGSNGRCFDIGNTVRAAIDRYRQTGEPYSGSSRPQDGGNGSLMRLAPIPMAYARVPERAIRLAGDMSRTTHGAPEPVDACRYYAGLIVGALQGLSKDVLLGPFFHPSKGQWESDSLSPSIEHIARGSFLKRHPPSIRGSGYVVHALEAALWAFASTDDFRSGALAAVNLGEDADTTGAIYGQLAGAYYGDQGIPVAWRDKLIMRDEITAFSDGLLDLSDELSAEPNQ